MDGIWRVGKVHLEGTRRVGHDEGITAVRGCVCEHLRGLRWGRETDEAVTGIVRVLAWCISRDMSGYVNDCIVPAHEGANLEDIGIVHPGLEVSKPECAFVLGG